VNFGQIFGGTWAVLGLIVTLMPIEAATNPTYTAVIGITVYYIADIAESLEDLNQKSGDKE